MYSGVCLVTSVHDPDARLLGHIKKYGKDLVRIYDGQIGAVITSTTSPDVKKAINSLGFAHIQQLKNTPDVSVNYKNALELGTTFNSNSIHLTDIDRALHWTKRFPNELRDIKEILPGNHGLTLFNRTKRAFESHPQVQKTTEVAINAIASELAGIEVDICSGSFGFSQELAIEVLKHGKAKDWGFFAEYLKIALKEGFDIDVLEVEGLEWETPDQYEDKIKKEGYVAWLQEFENLDQWKRRVKLLDESAEVLLKQ